MIGDYRHRVVVQQPGTPVSDGDGGYTTGWTSGTPATWFCSINPATARDLERVASGTTLATASHIVEGRYRADLTTDSRLLFDARLFVITGVSDPEERHITSICVCVELLNAPAVVDTSWTQPGWMQ